MVHIARLIYDGYYKYYLCCCNQVLFAYVFYHFQLHRYTKQNKTLTLKIDANCNKNNTKNYYSFS